MELLEKLNSQFSVVISKCDNILILGKFYMHVCCPENFLANEFLNLVESFNLLLTPTGPTHIKRSHLRSCFM